MTTLHPDSLRNQRHLHAHSPTPVFQDVYQPIDQETDQQTADQEIVATVVVFRAGGHQKIEDVQAKITQCLGEVKRTTEGPQRRTPSPLECQLKMVSPHPVRHGGNHHRIPPPPHVARKNGIVTGVNMVVDPVQQRRAPVPTAIVPQPSVLPRVQPLLVV